MTLKAGQVLLAVHAVYLGVGNAGYAEMKANNFLKRLGCKIEDGPEQEVEVESVKALAYAALDEDREKELFARLGL
jgi:hypothetical protein